MSFSSDLKAYMEKHSYTQAAATGHGQIEGTSDSVAFYQSQVVGVVKR